MSIPIEIHPKYPFRLVPLRFRRATKGDPDQTRPEIDDRASINDEHTGIVGMLKGKEITVRLERIMLEDVTDLYVTTSDSATLQITSPADGKLPNAKNMYIKIKALRGANPQIARLEVRLDSKTGIILHQLTVWAFAPLPVSVTPHIVSISDVNNPGIGPVADVNAIMVKVKEIWDTAGVTISIGAPVPEPIMLKAAGIVDDGNDTTYPLEVATVFNTNSLPSTINVYFVNQIGYAETLGYGFSRKYVTDSAKQFTSKPGIMLGDVTHDMGRNGIMHYANDLAHEIGHFFGLWHCENAQPPDEREDTWSRRKLMHNFNGTLGNLPWPAYVNPNDPPAKRKPYKYRPLLDDVGYGTGRRGCMVTMKKLSQLTTDGDVTTVRSTINSSAGPY